MADTGWTLCSDGDGYDVYPQESEGDNWFECESGSDRFFGGLCGWQCQDSVLACEFDARCRGRYRTALVV